MCLSCESSFDGTSSFLTFISTTTYRQEFFHISTNIQMLCGLNAKKKKKIIALYLMLKILLQKFRVSTIHFFAQYILVMAHKVITWWWNLLSFCFSLTLSETSPGFYVSAVKVFWKHCGKRRNCSLWALSPFPTLFSTHSFSAIFINSKIVVCKRFQFGRVKNLLFGKGLTTPQIKCLFLWQK